MRVEINVKDRHRDRRYDGNLSWWRWLKNQPKLSPQVASQRWHENLYKKQANCELLKENTRPRWFSRIPGQLDWHYDLAESLNKKEISVTDQDFEISLYRMTRSSAQWKIRSKNNYLYFHTFRHRLRCSQENNPGEAANLLFLPG